VIANTAATDTTVINFRSALALFWRGRLWISASVLVCTVAAALAAFLMTPVYRAETVMVSASADRSGLGSSLSSGLGSLGGLASLAGLAMGPGNTESEEALAVLRSREFAERFINDNHLLAEFYPKLWDVKTSTWKAGVRRPPTLGEAIKYFDSLRTITQDKKTGLITLQIDWRDPGKAALWANEMVNRLNMEMRSRAIASSETAVSYLQQELATTTVVETRQSISRVLEAQINKRMMANVTLQYAFRVVDKASIPDRDDPVRPRRTFLLIAGPTLGLVLSILLLIAFSPMGNKSDDQ
jgi:uncharacterized protein involved in exopolysaccharide biosynthesis